MGPIYEGTQYPSEYRNKLFYADFEQGWMAFAEIDENDNFISQTVFSSDVGGVVDIIYDPVSEYIYYVNLFDRAIYRLRYSGAMEVSREDDDNRIDTNVLLQNYPNPFNLVTTIRYDMLQRSNVKIFIYDVLGREVIQFVNKNIAAGYHQIQWNGQNSQNQPVSSGIYIYRMIAESVESGERFVQTRKMLLLK